jgi:hypothetical protein
MTVFRTLISISALLTAFANVPPTADAQTGQNASLAAKPAAATSWACTFKVVELAPVSLDTRGKATGWVMVHRVRGEVIAAERVSDQEVEQIRRMPCAGDRLEAPPPLVG